MNLIMKDFVKPEERLTLLVDYSGYECMGCGRLSDDIALENGFDDDDFDGYSRTTVEGNWYCHIDCFRDSR